jgi:hypothetical protein
MTCKEFVDLVRVMRSDQKDRDQHQTPAAAMKARWSEKQVDDALAATPILIEQFDEGIVDAPEPPTIIEGQS